MSFDHFHASAYEHFPAIGMRSAHAHTHTRPHSHGQASPPSSARGYTPSDEHHHDDEPKSATSLHKMRSKRDSAKFQRQQDYVHDRTLLEVVDNERCDRCHRNGWRCFIEANPDSPRRVCRPCGKNKCSYGNTQGTRPNTKPPRWAQPEEPKARRFEPYARSRDRTAEPLPGVAALTAWARPPLTPPNEPIREGSLELLAEAAHHAKRERTPLPDQPSSRAPSPYRKPALPFSAWEVEDDHRFFDLTMHYAQFVLPANRYNALAHLYGCALPLPGHH